MKEIYKHNGHNIPAQKLSNNALLGIEYYDGSKAISVKVDDNHHKLYVYLPEYSGPPALQGKYADSHEIAESALKNEYVKIIYYFRYEKDAIGWLANSKLPNDAKVVARSTGNYNCKINEDSIIGLIEASTNMKKAIVRKGASFHILVKIKESDSPPIIGNSYYNSPYIILDKAIESGHNALLFDNEQELWEWFAK